MTILQQYDLWTPEQREQYHGEWFKYKESFHDVNLEKNIDKMLIQLDINDAIFYSSKNDFKINYKDDENDLNQSFNHRTELKLLFEKGFKWILINEKNNLYERIVLYQIRTLRSPNTNICGVDKNELCLFVKDNKLYAYMGRSYCKNNNTFYFQFVGEIVEDDKTIQLSLFDF